ncbi:helix-turn-helix transcriptional regulator [Streptosporangium sp. 'caverna']|uniref:helix-turn-helix domain-containing protein n=1 Tax=Streptosporangium sp. 'caverna' TaxID=2202249 RepID=UPI000D7D8916|nr:helix-turn-helix transcriptional regulator [Streptosporangium sp. 'caverna']AWS41048.1 XRE family transcriptional regulator [Streptosporangium sp. 'caverna']
MAGTNPTLRRRQLANRLRELREQAGKSIKEAAEQLECSSAKISRIETAQRGALPRDVRDLCLFYGITDQAQIDALMTLAREAKQQVWWQATEDVDFRPFLGLEIDATSISEYETTTVPGLLQTEDYARAIIKGYLPSIDSDVLEERITYRMKRQERLYGSHPPKYWVLLDESVLHRHVGGIDVMMNQLTRLGETAKLPHVTIQVIPFKVGAHMGFDSAFNLLEFSDSTIGDTVYLDTLMGSFYLEKDKELERFRETLNHLRAVALSPQDSAIHIAGAYDRFAALSVRSVI